MQKVTHVAKKRSDGSVSREKDHYCGRGSEATGGRGVQKVTPALKKAGKTQRQDLQARLADWNQDKPLLFQPPFPDRL